MGEVVATRKGIYHPIRPNKGLPNKSGGGIRRLVWLTVATMLIGVVSMTPSDWFNAIVASGVILGVVGSFVKGYFTILNKLDKLSDAQENNAKAFESINKRIDLQELKYDGLEARVAKMEILGTYQVTKREHE